MGSFLHLLKWMATVISSRVQFPQQMSAILCPCVLSPSLMCRRLTITGYWYDIRGGDYLSNIFINALYFPTFLKSSKYPLPIEYQAHSWRVPQPSYCFTTKLHISLQHVLLIIMGMRPHTSNGRHFADIISKSCIFIKEGRLLLGKRLWSFF